MPILLVYALFSCSVLLVLKLVLESWTSRSLPPGPPRKPLIGNLLDLPEEGVYEWIHWAKHHDLYGPISSVSMFGQHIIIINDVQCAADLLDKRSSLYSDRFSSVFGGEMCGWQNSLAMTHNGDRFRQIRKHLHQTIGTREALRKFHHMAETEVRRFLWRTLKEPEKLNEHLRRSTGAIILSIAYGYTINPNGTDPLVQLADQTISEASIAFKPGSWMVDVLPILRYIPNGFPGSNFKKIAKHYYSNTMTLINKPYAFVKQQMALGTAKPSMTLELLEAEKPITPEEENLIQWAAASIYGGGNDTTVSINYSLVLAMIMYPEVQRKAQEELDRVVGTDRLPTYEDRPNLPYINAIVNEALRWNPVLSMGVPHVLSQDDTYRGYHLPKGSIVMCNLKKMTLDSRVYHKPGEFIPERFLGVDGREPEPVTDVMFGFGRRICPGKEMANMNIFMHIALILSVFNISRAKDESGKDIQVKNEWTPGLISRPKGFKFHITPRSEQAVSLIYTVDSDIEEKNDAQALENLRW